MIRLCKKALKKSIHEAPIWLLFSQIKRKYVRVPIPAGRVYFLFAEWIDF
jgi:hypothetical protein